MSTNWLVISLAVLLTAWLALVFYRARVRARRRAVRTRHEAEKEKYYATRDPEVSDEVYHMIMGRKRK